MSLLSTTISVIYSGNIVTTVPLIQIISFKNLMQKKFIELSIKDLKFSFLVINLKYKSKNQKWVNIILKIKTLNVLIHDNNDDVIISNEWLDQNKLVI